MMKGALTGMARSVFPLSASWRSLRGEPLDVVALQTNVSVARLTEWRDRALAGAATTLKQRERDDRDDEIARLNPGLVLFEDCNDLLFRVPLVPHRSP
jgi:hypothetical protein